MMDSKSDVYKNYVPSIRVRRVRVGGTGSRTPDLEARRGILDLYSDTLAIEQKSTLRVADYKDMFSMFGYRHVQSLRYRVDANVEFRVPHIHRLPYYYRRFLFVLGVDLYAGAYFTPLLDVREEDGRIIVEQGRVFWSGRYHPSYWHSHDLEYAERKVSELLSVAPRISERLWGYREDNYNFNKETLELSQRWEGVKKLKQNKVYVSRFLFTLPDKLSNFLMWLNVRHRDVYDKLIADLRQAVVRTMYHIMWYQLYRDAPFVAGERFFYRTFRNRYVVSFLMNMHIVHSFHFRDVDDVVDGDGGRDADVFSPHFHFHLLVLNVLYERETGDFIRVDWFYGTAYELMREWWTKEVLRVLRRYRDYLDAYDRRLYYELKNTVFVAGVDKSWEVSTENREEIMHFIKYSHRPPLADIVLWFEMHDTKRDFESLWEKYDESWLRYVLEYVNRTYPYGIFSNWERYGLSVSDKVSDKGGSEVDDVGSGVGNEDFIEKNVPYPVVFSLYLADEDRILLEDKVGKSSRFWLYMRMCRPP